MKKLVAFIILVFVVGLACIYIFIPAKLEISKIEYVNCNANGATRILGDENTWIKWWPHLDSVQSHFVEKAFFYDRFRFQLLHKFYDGAAINISKGQSGVDSRITIISVNPDSVIVLWKCELAAASSPFKRVSNYNEAKRIRKNMGVVLASLRTFLENKDNIYGIHLHVTMSKDSTLVAIKNKSPNYPSTAEIYDLVGQLKSYISEQNAVENNFPMLNVKKTDDNEFETMVAIPVNKELRGKNKIFFSRFVPWKVLTAEVKGGVKSVDEALRQMNLNMTDYQKTKMAISFQSLVTNRMKEPDTLKWITRIYTPVP
jgi:hypothetical protein